MATMAAYSLSAYLSNADIVGGTSPFAGVVISRPVDDLFRSGSANAWNFALKNEQVIANYTAHSEGVSVAYAIQRPEDVLLLDLVALKTLREGWDGEHGLPPRADAIRDAVLFVVEAGSKAADLEATPHADGSLMLEIGDGSMGSFRFLGNGQISYAIGSKHGMANFDSTLPSRELMSLLPEA